MRSWLAVPLLALLAVLCGCPSDTYTLTLANSTQSDLVPYPVVTTPPPPHREPDAANTLAHNDSTLVDVDGFNPLYYSPELKIGVVIQMDLLGEPPQLFVRAFDYAVAPDQVTDEASQVTLREEMAFEITKTQLELNIGRTTNGFPVTFTES